MAAKATDGKSRRYNCWQLHTPDESYIRRVIKHARDYDINIIVLSHEIIKYVSQLYEEKERVALIGRICEAAHKQGLQVYIWPHELEHDVPPEYFNQNVIDVDRPGFWDWLGEKYEKLCVDFPQFDGFVFTFHETPYKVFDKDQVQSEFPASSLFARMINTINAPCLRHDKEVVVRSFFYEPEEIEWFRKGMEHVDDNVILQCKCVPHDWDPFYPHNPMIGALPSRQKIIEFDCSSEYTGRNRIPYAAPDYFHYRWKYSSAQPGIVGYNARLDHRGFDALFTPNEINIYSLYRLTREPDITPDRLWREWTMERYGKDAAHFIEQALRPTFRIVNKMLWPLGCRFNDHSRLPFIEYAETHLAKFSVTKWASDNEQLKETREKVLNPDPLTLEDIIREKEEALALADICLGHLERAADFLSARDFKDLCCRMTLLRRMVEVWRLHAEAFFGYEILKRTGLEGQENLSARTKRAISSLYRQAEVSRVSGQKEPCSEERISGVADELKKQLEGL